MSNDELPVYERGAIAMDSGDLIDVTNVTVNQKRPVTVQHTIRQSAAGVFIGNEEVDGTFDSTIPPSGLERDYYLMLKTGKIKTIRIKIPGETFALVVAVEQRTITIPTDAPVKCTITFKGKTEA